MPEPLKGKSTTSEIRLYRCRDPQLIETILREDYYDAPVCYFPRSLIQATAHGWFAHSSQIEFVIAEIGGQYAGFAFGHNLGPTFWKKFARAHAARHALGLAWVLLQLRGPSVLRKRRQSQIRLEIAPRSADDVVHRRADMRLERRDHKFDWSPESPEVGQIDLLLVRKEFRGRGIASRLLHKIGENMAVRGVRRIEAHIDADNYNSIRSFQKAGFEVVQMSGGDHYAYRQMVSTDDLAGQDRVQ
jgi:GNAT superfamily N-acetyltransferase